MKIAFRSRAADGRCTKNAMKMPTVSPASPIAAAAWPIVPAVRPLTKAAAIAATPKTIIAMYPTNTTRYERRRYAVVRASVWTSSRRIDAASSRSSAVVCLGIPVPRAGQPHRHGLPSFVHVSVMRARAY